MIKMFSIILVFLTSFCVYTQDVKLKFISNKFYETKQTSEEYYVLKSNRQIKNGLYKSYFKLTEFDIDQIKKGYLSQEDFIKEIGYYENNKKEGEWIKYKAPKLIKTKGSFHNDKKIGVWYFSYEEGQVIEYFNFDNNNQDSLLINVNMVYPDIAVDSELQGVVIVNFKIDNNCSISNINILKSLSQECDEVSIDSVKKYGYFLSKYSKKCEERIKELKISFNLEY